MNRESSKQLRDYLGGPKWMRIVQLALLALAAIFFVAGIILLSKDPDPASAVEFYPDDDALKRKYVYVDVIGVSDYIASYGTTDKWYIALDPYGFGYVLKLDYSQFLSLSKHVDWWYSDEEYDIDPTRIYGMPAKISDELADIIQEVFEYDSREDVYDVFGKYYLNAPVTPYEGPGGFLMFLAILSLVSLLVLFTTSAVRNEALKRCIKRLNQLGLTDEAAAQLESPVNEIIGDDVTRISQDFIYCKQTGTVIPLSDILWVYGHVQRYNGAVVSETLQAATRNNKTQAICQVSKKKGTDTDSFSRIMEVIHERFPDVMLGYSLENLNAYGTLCKEEKAKTSGNS